MVQIKLELEKIILIIFFIILLFIGPGSLLDYRIKHEFPYAYLSSDSFQHQIRAEAVKDAGNFRYEAFYISKGFEKAVGRYPPIIYHLSVIFSYATGLEVYDAIYFIVFFFSIIGAFVMYLIIRNFNKNVALIALPLAIIMISPQLYIDQNNSLTKVNFGINTGFAYGHWPSLLSQVFLIGFFWCIMRLDSEKSYIFTAIIFSSIILTHTSEAVFALIFLGLFFLIRLIGKNLKKIEVRNIAIALAISFIFSVYYVIIFMNTWAKANPYTFSVDTIWKGNPGIYIGSFGLLLIFMAAGFIFSLFKLLDMHISLISAFAMLISGSLNYIGFELRAFQIRFFWPIYLSVFFGFGVYIVLKLFIKMWNMIYTALLVLIFTVLLMGIIKIPHYIKVPSIPHYNKLVSQGLMDSYHWSALNWLSKNAEFGSKIYFFYGDIYSQDALLRNSKRLHYQVDPDDFFKALNERKIKRNYVSELPGDGGGGIVTRLGLFKFEDVIKSKPQEYFFGIQDICKFDYLVFDKPRNDKDIKIYNLMILSELSKKNFISKVFENEGLIVLKNSKIGADCIEERSF